MICINDRYLGKYLNMFEFMPIPKVFHPFLENGPFETCTVCNCSLLAQGVDYLIEKTFKGTEVICEYAICMASAEKMSTELSQESMMRVRAHMEERVDLLARAEKLLAQSPDKIQPWLAHCVLTGTPQEDTDVYHICGHFHAKDLVLSIYPFMICGEAINQMSVLLSKKTRETLDDFTDEFLGMPPAYRDLFDDSPLLLL
jgi:hypothetical protein